MPSVFLFRHSARFSCDSSASKNAILEQDTERYQDFYARVFSMFSPRRPLQLSLVQWVSFTAGYRSRFALLSHICASRKGPAVHRVDSAASTLDAATVYVDRCLQRSLFFPETREQHAFRPRGQGRGSQAGVVLSLTPTSLIGQPRLLSLANDGLVGGGFLD